MVREKKLSKYLLISGLIHVVLALAMSVIYAEQPRDKMGLKIVSAVRIQYEEPEPPPMPKPKVVTKAETQKKTAPKKKEPKVIPQKVEPTKVTTRRRPMNAPAPGLPTEKALQRSRSAPGVAGIKGTRGAPGDRPGMRASGGISHPTLTTKTGGSGLSPGITHGSMQMPAGSSSVPGVGGKDMGFRVGVSPTGDGVGDVDIDGSGGSGGSRGRDVEGPGAGLADVGRRNNPGGGKGTTGLGVGETSGMGGTESEPGGGKAGGGGGGGPGSGGYNPVESRSGPSLISRTGVQNASDRDLPKKKELPEEERAGATGKKDFKADLGKGMTNIIQSLDKPVSPGFDDVLAGEINKNMHTLRKIHEDWQHLKLPDIPKALQITIELNLDKGKPKLVKADFHNPSLSSRITGDLIKKIKEWKFESLYDGKDDPKKWPVRLSGMISWQ